MKFEFTTKNYSLARTLLCGQCFRFAPDGEGAYTGFARGTPLMLRQEGDAVTVTLPEGADGGWLSEHFAFGEDYAAIDAALCEDWQLARMVEACRGIRILRQPFWEMLCSSILSQNNNIPRIESIIARFCEAFGAPRFGGFDFPTPQAVAALCAEQLGCIRCGYRAPYLCDAAQKLLSGAVTEEAVRALPLDEAREMLMQIKGVGRKVADCTLLFGAGRLDAFPEDVWIRRAMAQYFPEGLPACAAPYAGIAQQYIFHYARTAAAQSPAAEKAERAREAAPV